MWTCPGHNVPLPTQEEHANRHTPGCRVVVVGPGKCANRRAQARRLVALEHSRHGSRCEQMLQATKRHGQADMCWRWDRLAGKQATLHHQVTSLPYGCPGV